VASGYEEYLHAVGHQVGRSAHDGGTILGPRWERYGSTPYREVQEREVYTLELGVVLPGRGYLGLEEMVQVTSTGVEWLTDRQLEMPTLG
jgi:Xaa-Pro aminopeptidase